MEDVVEVAVADWTWLSEQLGVDSSDAPPLSSASVELLMREQIALDHRDWLVQGIIEFDSEGDQAVLVTPNSEVAAAAKSSVEKLFLDRRRLRKRARALGSIG